MGNAITAIFFLFGIPALLVAWGLWRCRKNKPVSGLLLFFIGVLWAFGGYQLLFMGRVM